MLRGLTNVLYRRRDPTRLWTADAAQLVVDVVRCTLAGAALGGDIERAAALGAADDALEASGGYPSWYGQGISCTIENKRLADFTVYLKPLHRIRPYAGRFLAAGQPAAIAHETVAERIVSLLGEPFARSHNDWDVAVVLFYEYPHGEVKFAFDKQEGLLQAIECWYEPELAQAGACEKYGIGRAFPDALRRTLPS